jgi:hypothetical protein
LTESPIKEFGLLRPVPATDLTLYCSLFHALGANPALTRAEMSVSIDTGKACVAAIQSLTKITELSLHFLQPGDDDVNMLLTAVRERDPLAILEIRYFCPSINVYDLFLPGLVRVPLPQKIVLGAWNRDHSDRYMFITEDTRVARPTAEVLQLESLPHIVLHFITLEDGDVSRVFCKGVAASQPGRITIMDCFIEYTPLLTALAVPRPSLTELDLLHLIRWPYDFVCEEEAILTLIRAAKNWHLLRILKLPRCHYTKQIDTALAELVRSNAQLEVLAVHSPRQAPADPKVCAPELLEALKDSYTIQQVDLFCLDPNAPAITDRGDWTEPIASDATLREGGGDDPWDPATVRAIHSISRLNAAGRAYVAHDSTNVRLFYSVLEQVTDDLHCIYFLLRGSPWCLNGLYA